MSEHDSDHGGVSRRNVLLGIGAAAGAAAAVTALPARVSAAPRAALVPMTPSDVPEALGAPIAGLSYIGIDAEAFFPSGSPTDRLYEDITGTKLGSSGWLRASFSLPAGSVIYQLNVGYQGQPVAAINKRPVTQPNPAVAPQNMFLKSLAPSPGGPFSSTENLPTPIVIDRESTYTVNFFVSPGQAIFGCALGYLPATQGFVPFTGGEPRVLDTRLPGPLTGKLLPDKERVVNLGIAGARTAVINLTVTDTVTAGYVAVFPANIEWPKNSSINWSSSNQILANGVITAVDGSGQIKIRGGANPTHVVIDRIGYMI